MADDGFKGTEAENSKEMLSLHEMFRIVGDEMTPKDVGALKTANGIVSGDLLGKVSDGRGYLIALERLGQIDETNFKQIFQLLTWTKRHDLYPYVTLRRRKTGNSGGFQDLAVCCYLITEQLNFSIPAILTSNGKDPTKTPDVVPDPVDEYLEETSHNSIKKRRCFEQSRDDSRDSCIAKSLSDDTTLLPGKYEKGLKNKNTKKGHRGRRSRKQPLHEELKHEEDEIKKKVTCDIRLRVRAEYCHHDNVLEGNVFSNKPELVERQFEKFAQANTILKSRDLGSIICDIKFSELTYLDAFWRDYINGSLLEALKGVFITESLKQAVGHEAIKLLVNVDEDDYEAGRLQLLQNLKE